MKFLIDGMLGKLARWLRLLGYDVDYEKDVSDSQLISWADSRGCVLLTSDIMLHRLAVARGVKSYLVKGGSEAERLSRVAKRFNLNLDVNLQTSRCPTCGSPIKPVSKTSVIGKVPLTTYRAYRQFWVCINPNCEKIYWKGSHWKKIYENLSKAKKLVDASG